jgi:hypothetical protein
LAHLIKATWVLALVVLSSGITEAADEAKQSTVKAAVPRALYFPGTQSCGTLLLVPSESPMGDEASNRARSIAVARGKVEVLVPSGYLLELFVNQRLLQNPKLFDEITPSGIDGLKIDTSSMSKEEDGRCDGALKHITHFPNLLFLDMEKSDVTDFGIISIKSLKKLKELSVSYSRVSGDCFKNLSPQIESVSAEGLLQLNKKQLGYLAALASLKKLQLRSCKLTDEELRIVGKFIKLERLDLSQNGKISNNGIKSLGALKDLNHLFLERTSVTDQALKDISLHKKLTFLSLRSNKITDAAIPFLQQMSNLEGLDLRGTSITMNGLAKLKGLQLQRVWLPNSSNPRSEFNELQQWFPHTAFWFTTGGARPEDVRLIY